MTVRNRRTRSGENHCLSDSENQSIPTKQIHHKIPSEVHFFGPNSNFTQVQEFLLVDPPGIPYIVREAVLCRYWSSPFARSSVSSQPISRCVRVLEEWLGTRRSRGKRRGSVSIYKRLPDHIRNSRRTNKHKFLDLENFEFGTEKINLRGNFVMNLIPRNRLIAAVAQTVIFSGSGPSVP